MPATIAKDNGIPVSTLYGWMRGHAPKNNERLEKVMKYLQAAGKRLEKHPSYGCATQDEIDELQKVGVGARYYEILKKIEDRTKRAGKLK